nr:immunoglobulin heavy chain junction region [Macaca mulatta]MOW76162.1 immunoglobulin heavy chain junction region [Macaca mulatta]MOW77007.1 immunoglobulin heavy chain junction region [Macaca mulatta]MOW79010.1 immunoglobulin heavy chain junction region [Macaca mulatta]MOW85601.1 immunoglobulin heavy chain junction region [Macaca mulatta]
CASSTVLTAPVALAYW